MSQHPDHTVAPKTRLSFIDISRGIALLLMIEGHFTDAALQLSFRNDSHLLYTLWREIHGHTASIFFTITGLVFVYLMSGTSTSTPFLRNRRVVRGLRRSAELIAWGYLIQIDGRTSYFWLFHGGAIGYEWLSAFHVLQSIGLCLLMMIGIFALYRRFPFVPLYAMYVAAAVVMFFSMSTLNLYIAADRLAVATTGVAPSYIPAGYPVMIQNFIYGPYSEFSVIRYGMFVMIGAALGHLVRLFQERGRLRTLAIALLVTCAALVLLMRSNLDFIAMYDSELQLIRGLDSVAVIALIMLITTTWSIEAPWLSRLGRTTFPVYVFHVIVLYGGLTGLGLKPWIVDRNFTPLQTALFSACALILCVSAAFLFDRITTDLKHRRTNM